MTTDTERLLRELDDRAQIIQGLNLYGLAIDAQQYDLFDRVFAEDFVGDYNPPAYFRSRAEVKQVMYDFHIDLDGSLHRITNHQVLLDGDRASSMSYVLVRLLKGADHCEMAGFYDDQWVRKAEGWRIQKRKFRGSWASGSEAMWGDYPPKNVTLLHAREAGEVAYIKALG
jgi:hypothetical protein